MSPHLRSLVLGTFVSLALASFAPAQQTSSTSYAVISGESGVASHQNVNPGLSSTISDTYTYPGEYADMSASVSPLGVAGYNKVPDLHSYTTASLDAYYGFNFGANASATYQDTFKVYVNPLALLLDGGSVTVTWKYTIDGSTAGGGNGDFMLVWGGNQDAFYPITGTELVNAPFNTANLTEDPNDPSVFSGAFTESLTTSVEDDANSLTGEANFTNTATLTEVTVTDANGDPVDATIYDTNADGSAGPISFQANTVLTPEPSTWALSLCGLVALAVTAKRRSWSSFSR